MKRINDLVRKLVDAGRVAAVPGGLSTVPLADLVAKAAAEARVRGGGRVAVVEFVPPGLAVRARRESLEQVMSILVANAVEAVPREREGRIEVRADRTGTMARVSVRDDGAGMSPRSCAAAFDPFFTTKPEGRRRAGLPVARGIVEATADAWLESHPGAGTTAVRRAPRRARDHAAPGLSPVAGGRTPRAFTRGRARPARARRRARRCRARGPPRARRPRRGRARRAPDRSP